MKIEKILLVEQEVACDELWKFYHEHFAPLNEKTPLAQSLDRQTFKSWMQSPRAIKFVVRNGRNAVAGLAVVSDDLQHDPLISAPFFQKKHPDKHVYHFPAFALSKEFRANPVIHRDLMHAMMAEMPEDAIFVFFHSEGLNPALPRLVRRACRPKAAVEKIDAMGCVLCTWAQEGLGKPVIVNR